MDCKIVWLVMAHNGYILETFNTKDMAIAYAQGYQDECYVIKAWN